MSEERGTQASSSSQRRFIIEGGRGFRLICKANVSSFSIFFWTQDHRTSLSKRKQQLYGKRLPVTAQSRWHLQHHGKKQLQYLNANLCSEYLKNHNCAISQRRGQKISNNFLQTYCRAINLILRIIDSDQSSKKKLIKNCKDYDLRDKRGIVKHPLDLKGSANSNSSLQVQDTLGTTRYIHICTRQEPFLKKCFPLSVQRSHKSPQGSQTQWQFSPSQS